MIISGLSSEIQFKINENLTAVKNCHCRLVLLWHCWKSVQIRAFFWSVFSRIWTEYGLNAGKYEPEKTPYLDNFHKVWEMWTLNLVTCVIRFDSVRGYHSIRMWENTDQKISEYEHFSRSENCSAAILKFMSVWEWFETVTKFR